ncbi:hypothetical protein D3C76_1516590 [compost metagenome]
MIGEVNDEQPKKNIRTDVERMVLGLVSNRPDNDRLDGAEHNTYYSNDVSQFV